ncbi:hypothetical protein EON80_00445 [bacterium]|nr:MAG: hypothetical protein EON80_00445 [bacterium]
MAKNFGRDVALLTLPVVLFAGLARWRALSGIEVLPTPTPVPLAIKPRLAPPLPSPTVSPIHWVQESVPAPAQAQNFFKFESLPVFTNDPKLPRSLRVIDVWWTLLRIQSAQVKRAGKWSELGPSDPITEGSRTFLQQRQFTVDNAVRRTGAVATVWNGRLPYLPPHTEAIRLRGQIEGMATYFDLKTKKPAFGMSIGSPQWSKESVKSPPFEVTVKGPFNPSQLTIFAAQNPVLGAPLQFIEGRVCPLPGKECLQLWIKPAPGYHFHVESVTLRDPQRQVIPLYLKGRPIRIGQKEKFRFVRETIFGLTLLAGEEMLVCDLQGASPKIGWRNSNLPLNILAKLKDEQGNEINVSGDLMQVRGTEQPFRRAYSLSY